ncbi:hypothetical protein [Microbacterium aerolatum]|uniref:hypothetical protein n=1 Tax=Microbacterium aerolatum TaxID=153731 RepID=UPI00384DE068
MSNEIKQGVYVSVGGKVGRVFTYQGDKTGVEIHVQDERMRYPDRYTAFDVKQAVAEGDLVEVHGWLSTQVEEYTKKDGTTGHGVKRIVNAPKIAKHEPAAPAPVDDAWATETAPF